MGKRNDLTGQRFGRLTVESFAYVAKGGNTIWNCKCDCGGRTVASTRNLRAGNVKSCGCLQHIGYTKTHGESKTRLWYIWRGIKKRTELPNDKDYNNYGGRGITMCEAWKNSYVSFRDWAMSHGYREDLSIDRIDVNGSYCPENCRWIPMEEQAGNKRNNVRYTYQGETLTLSEWARKKQMSRCGLWGRIHLLGWTVEEALETPVGEHRKKQ